MALRIVRLHFVLSLILCPCCSASRQLQDRNELDTQGLEGLGAESSKGPEEGGKAEECGFLVFSDMDDTMACSRGALLTGIDCNCNTSKAIYPGMGSFFWNLARGPGPETCDHPSKVIPLSARPRELVSIPFVNHFVEIKAKDPANQALREAGKEGGVPDWGLDVDNAIYGSAFVVEDALRGDFTAMASNKFEGWKQRVATTTIPTIFVGDNGQGDALAATQMIDSQDSSIAAAFIHHVQFSTSPTSSNTMLWNGHTTKGNEEALYPKDIFLFQNYAEAACRAVTQGLMKPEGYTHVMKSIIDRCFDKGEGLKDRPAEFEELEEECRVLYPEFGMRTQHGSFYIRPPKSCNRARDFARSDFSSLTGRLNWVGGLLSVGHCNAVTDDLLQSITQATQFVHAHVEEASRALDYGESYHEKGVTTLLLQAVLTGFHCISQCDEQVDQSKASFEVDHEGWTLVSNELTTLTRIDNWCEASGFFQTLKSVRTSIRTPSKSGRSILKIAAETES